MARSSASTIISPMPPAHEPRQRLWRIVAKRAVLAAGAIERPHRVRRQRPARRHAGRRGAHLRQPLRRRAGPARGVFTNNDDGCAHRRAISPRPASRSRRWSMRDRAPRRARKRRRPRRRRALSAGGARCQHVRGGHARARRRGRRRRAAATERFDCDLRRRVRRLEPDRPPHHAISAASRVWNDALAALRARHAAAGHERRRRGRGLVRPWRMPGRGPCGRRWRAAAECGFTAHGRRSPPLPTKPARRRRRCGTSPAAAARPSSISRTTSPATDVELAAARRLPLGRAPQALHHARHGDRPGQDLQRHRPGDHGRCHRAAMSARSAPRPSARPTRRSRSARFAGHHRGQDFRPTRLAALA